MREFMEALSDFSHDVASGGAIRHLTDLGYTSRQIMDSLDFPTPVEKVRKTMWRRLLEKGVVLLGEPCEESAPGRDAFVREVGPYGRTSFRKVSAGPCGTPIDWRESRYGGNAAGASNSKANANARASADASGEAARGRFGAFLDEKCAKNGEAGAYASLSLRQLRRTRKDLGDDMGGITDAPYLVDLSEMAFLAGESFFCHRLNERMRRAVAALYGMERYSGTLYFSALREKVAVLGAQGWT